MHAVWALPNYSSKIWAYLLRTISKEFLADDLPLPTYLSWQGAHKFWDTQSSPCVLENADIDPRQDPLKLQMRTRQFLHQEIIFIPFALFSAFQYNPK